MAGASLAILISGFLRGSKGREPERSVFPSQLYKKVFLLVLSLVAYLFLLEPAGFFFCTLLFMAFLLRVVASQKWRSVILASVSTSIGASLLFQWLLKCQLPTGITGF